MTEGTDYGEYTASPMISRKGLNLISFVKIFFLHFAIIND